MFLQSHRIRSKSRTQQANPPRPGGVRLRVNLRVQLRIKAILFLLVFSLAATLLHASEGPADSRPLNTTQLTAWLIGGVSSSRLAGLVEERGLATLPTRTELRQVEA